MDGDVSVLSALPPWDDPWSKEWSDYLGGPFRAGPRREIVDDFGSLLSRSSVITMNTT